MKRANENRPAAAERLAAVQRAAADAVLAVERLDRAVASARAAEVSWAEIGSAAGMTRFGARERWGHPDLVMWGWPGCF